MRCRSVLAAPLFPRLGAAAVRERAYVVSAAHRLPGTLPPALSTGEMAGVGPTGAYFCHKTGMLREVGEGMRPGVSRGWGKVATMGE